MKQRIVVLLTVVALMVAMMVGFGTAIALAADENASCLGRTVSDANQLGPGVGGLAEAGRAQEPGAPGVGDIAPCR